MKHTFGWIRYQKKWKTLNQQLPEMNLEVERLKKGSLSWGLYVCPGSGDIRINLTMFNKQLLSAYKHKRIFTLLNSLKANIRMHGVTTKICINISLKRKRKWRVQINSQQGPRCMLQRKIFINPHDTTPIWIVKWKNVPAWEFKQRTLTVVNRNRNLTCSLFFTSPACNSIESV